MRTETYEGVRWETLGGGASGWSRLRQAATGLAGRVAAVPVRAGADVARHLLRRPIPLYVGDVTSYLARRGTVERPGPIPTLVGAAIEQAAEKSGPGRPLIVVAHSMGGNICYDVLTYFRPELSVDVLVTVGSQVGLFEELKLLAVSDAEVPRSAGDRVPRPPNIRRWINVVDRADPLAFLTDPIFADTEDYVYTSGALWAHSGYMRQPNFHRRLAGRVWGEDR